MPEYTGPVTPEPQSHLEGTAPGSGQVGQTPAVTQLSEKLEEDKPTKAKSEKLASTGMNSSSTTALGLSLICLVGLVVRRKLLK